MLACFPTSLALGGRPVAGGAERWTFGPTGRCRFVRHCDPRIVRACVDERGEPMDRLHALDAGFLHLEDGISHMHLGGMSVFDGSPPSEEALCGLLASKLERIPRYRQRARSVPFELGRPVWLDDPHFDLGYHVRSTALVEPADEEAVSRLVGPDHVPGARPQPPALGGLDRARPARWSLGAGVEGPPLHGRRHRRRRPARSAPRRGARRRPTRTGTVGAEPRTVRRRRWCSTPGAERRGDLAGRVGRVPSLVAHPVAAARSLGDTALGLARFGQRLGPTPSSPVGGTIGPHRTWAHARASFDDVRLIRKSLGGTVNDVVLAAVTRGFRERAPGPR